jgi:uncharacterized coiled-coil protein SlyX
MSEQPPQSDHRIEKLELSAGYAERNIDVLSGEIAQLNKAMSMLTLRLERLESRIIEINDKVGEAPPVVPPPHSAGPDVPREPL